MKKVLYICPELPLNPDSGGKRVFIKNLNSLFDSADIEHLDCVFINIDSYSIIDDFPLTKKNNGKVFIFERREQKIGQLSVFHKLIAFFKYVINSNPRFIHVRDNDFAKVKINDLIAHNNYDVIISDHLASYALVKEHLSLVTHISHNIESDIFIDRFKYANGIERFFSIFEFFKTKKIESQVYNHFKQVYFLSDSDKVKAEEMLGVNNAKRGSFIIPFHNVDIDFSKNKNNVIFIGGEGYFPNKDAIEWICNELAPLTKDITYKIVGANDNLKDKYKNVTNVIFLGFITEEELEMTIRTARLMISPVIFGSGIKIKVVESLSYGLPCYCTNESMKGIEIKDGCKPFDRSSSIEYIANEIETLIKTDSELISMKKSIVEFYTNNKEDFMINIIRNS